MDLSSLMETVFSVGIVVAMVALVAWRRYKEGQGKPASGKRAVSAGTGKRPVMQRSAEREPVEKREPMPSQKRKEIPVRPFMNRKQFRQLPGRLSLKIRRFA